LIYLPQLNLLIKKKAKASEKLHCEVPYSSANKKEKLKLVFGLEINSIYVALTELMLIPDWDKILFLSASPVQELFPSLSIVGSQLLHHRLIILRRWQKGSW
jgi:hypothetical protein